MTANDYDCGCTSLNFLDTNWVKAYAAINETADI